MKKTFIEAVSIIIVLAIMFGVSAIMNFNDTEYVVTVTDKERVTDVDNETSKYLVFSEDEQGNSIVFENTDTLFRWKFDSSNIQGQLKVGDTYKITVVGFRIPFLSMYQNIIEVETINEDKPNA